MWRLLRSAFPEMRFRRQVPIRSFIVDFASHRARLVIECDGGQHNGNADARRTSLIEAEGYRLLRFWNNDVLQNPSGVHDAMAAALRVGHPTQPPPSRGRSIKSQLSNHCRRFRKGG